MRIAIASGKGGAGKTTVTASLASVWDRPFIAVDTDVEAPNLHLFLPPAVEASETVGLEVPILDPERCTLCGACRAICRYKANALIDSPPGVSCPAMTVGLDADAVLLVAEPTPFGFHDFRLAHQAFRQIGKPVAVIMNRAAMPGNAEGDGALRAYCAEQGLRVLGELPFDRAAAETYAKGRLIAATSPEWRVRFESLRDAVLTFAEGACHA